MGLGAKLGLYGNVAGGDYAGARGTIGFGGEHDKFNSSMMTLDLRLVYDTNTGEFRVEPAELKGVCEANFEAYLKTALINADIEWDFEAF